PNSYAPRHGDFGFRSPQHSACGPVEGTVHSRYQPRLGADRRRFSGIRQLPARLEDRRVERGAVVEADQRTRMKVTLPIQLYLRFEVPELGEPASYICPPPA